MTESIIPLHLSLNIYTIKERYEKISAYESLMNPQLKVLRQLGNSAKDLLHDYEDIRDLRAAKEVSKDQKGVPLDKVITDLGL